MRSFVALAFCLALFGVGPIRADLDVDSKAILDKAIKAAGGEAKLAKSHAFSWKAKGTVEANGLQIAFTEEATVQGFDQYNGTFDMMANGMNNRASLVTSGGKGWIQANGKTMDAPKEVVTLRQQLYYAARLPQLLLPLGDKMTQVAPLGEIKIGDRLAVGLRTTHKELGDVNLFFDKETGLVARSDVRVKTPDNMEHALQIFFSDYKEIDGLKHFTKIVLHVDDKKTVEMDLTEWKPLEKLDASVFAKP